MVRVMPREPRFTVHASLDRERGEHTMGRLMDDMARLVGEIHAARDDRGRLVRNLKHAAAETRRAVAHVRRSFAADLAGARAAWLGATAPVSPRAGVPETAAPRGRGGEAAREDVLREAEEERRRLEAERQARDEAQMARKAGRRHRPR